MDIGDKIKALRLEKGLTLEQLGDKVGVGKSTVRKWEDGLIQNMRRDKIAKLASALDTTPAYLMGWEEMSPDKPSDDLSLNDHERDLILAYRSKPAMQAAVDTLLGLASSSSPSGSGYICKSNDGDGKTVSSIIADDVIETIKEKTSAAKTGSSK